MFFKKRNFILKKKFYECGFTSTTDTTIQITLNFAIWGAFLVLYDAEFIFLFPAIFNLNLLFINSIIVLYIFSLLLITSLVYDWFTNALSWSW